MPRFSIKAPANFSLRHTVLAHGWVNLAPFSFDRATGRLFMAFQREEALCAVSIVQTAPDCLRLTSDTRLNKSSMAGVRRALGLDDDHEGLVCCARRLSSRATALCLEGHGRLLRSPSAWEDLARTLLTTNCSWRNTQLMCSRLCELLGPRVSGIAVFPSDETVATADEAFLRQCALGYRVSFLRRTAAMCLEARNDQETRALLDAGLPGFGPYAAGHARVLLGDYSALPVDSDVRPYLLSIGCREDSLASAYARWGKFRYWGYKLGRIARGRNWIGD